MLVSESLWSLLRWDIWVLNWSWDIILFLLTLNIHHQILQVLILQCMSQSRTPPSHEHCPISGLCHLSTRLLLSLLTETATVYRPVPKTLLKPGEATWNTELTLLVSLHENYLEFKFMSVNEVLLKHNHTNLHIVQGCFCIQWWSSEVLTETWWPAKP